MKILLLGANGQLGRKFIAEGSLARLGELVAASRDGSVPQGIRGVVGDLADSPALEALLDAERPDIIVNAAAYTAVDKAEAEEDAANVVNGEAPGLLGRWAARHEALVVHFSTDYVFPGDASAPYGTDAAVDPQGAYGRSKLAGEVNLRASGARHFILRTAWVYSDVGHNFLKTMLRLGAERDELRVVADQRGTPTTAALIVAGTMAVLEHYTKDSALPLSGTWHLTAGGETTWHGFAEAIFDEAVATGLLSRRPRVHAIATAEFPTPARRPAYSVLDNRSFSATFSCSLPDWRVGLRETIHALSAH
ncbi:dTDP-4-dehydrorhamnose reductase [Luteibacter aegosomatissinici]|uniref:dTDP-4-dehydrorhamnose reductase n=1 Tax=Luteibacter aegosomatissinici TaxID=2911539 RepID=UPI001FF99807|nr:dTDP-4-dehydrorhamnose reductase [Luteibacter aegosomatissinici]UPG95345.1 dTDP-4-dehydrorhamnose reductase [Luteibacter aegosomatissinici]